MPIVPGKIQELPVFAITDQHILLGDEAEHIPLRRRELRRDVREGELLRVFVFYNEDRQKEASLRLPDIEVGGLGSFRIAHVADAGAFIQIGTSRDILIPPREQRIPLEAGRMTLVTLQCDEVHKRLFASTRFTHFFRNTQIPYRRGDEVELVIAEKIEAGYRVIINGQHLGVLFRQDLLRKVHEGERLKGYIRKIEGKDIVVSLQKEGEALVEDAVQRLLEFLQTHKGYVRLNDDSDPEEIKLRLRMSKKTFKKAVGQLYKERRIALTRFGIRLVQPDTPSAHGDR